MPGRTERAPEAVRPREELEAERRTRALEEHLDVRIRPGTAYPRVEVRNPAHGTRYDVLFPGFPQRDGAFCSCTDFARRGIGTCKHVEAAWRWLEERPEAALATPAPFDGGPLWEEIDRRHAHPSSERPIPLRIRRPGAVLIEGFPSPSGPAARR